MANSAIRRRQEAERQRNEAYDAVLRASSRRERPTPDFTRALDQAIRGFAFSIIRERFEWRPQLKTRDPARLRLAAARHLFARYPVAPHLERIWIDSDGLEREEIRLRKHWYIVAAGGGSLYATNAGTWMTRKEVHVFLTAGAKLGFEETMWYAIARSFTADEGAAQRIGRSKIARMPRAQIAFWREVARFFCVNQASIEEIDDLCDYLADCHQRNPAYSLKGRTLASLGRQMREWHHDLDAIARIELERRRIEQAQARARGRTGGGAAETATGGGRWSGAALADWSWRPSEKKRSEFVLTQLRTAEELVAESRAMRHCVWTYAARCIAGHCSIWSLRHFDGRDMNRQLTIELDRQQRIVQVRGVANRSIRPDERNILDRWAKARGVRWP